MPASRQKICREVVPPPSVTPCPWPVASEWRRSFSFLITIILIIHSLTGNGSVVNSQCPRFLGLRPSFLRQTFQNAAKGSGLRYAGATEDEEALQWLSSLFLFLLDSVQELFECPNKSRHVERHEG